MKRILRNILYISIFVIAVLLPTYGGEGGSLLFVTGGVDESAEQLDVSVDEDTVPQRRVKKTDYTQDERPEDYSFDLADPENLKYEVGEYDEKSGMYKVGTKLSDNFLSTPWLMSPEEYMEWTERKSIEAYFKQRNDSMFVSKGKDKFDFTNMKFDLGPAEKIFGPGGVQVKTQGSAELKLGYNYKYVDNPSLSERNRKTTGFDFDEQINLSVNAKVGDKMDFNLNYNTDATFDYDAKNLKLKYEGKEDEIFQLIEAGNVSMPTNSSLITGASSLFGVRADMQFGKLKLQTVVSQKKSQSKTVTSKGGTQLTDFDIECYDYDANRHFFLAQYFRSIYDDACANLPTITSGITINNIEIWVTNTNGATENTRDIVGFVDLGEGSTISNSLWTGSGGAPRNSANDLYSTMNTAYPNARSLDQVSSVLDAFLTGGVDYEKIENARLLSSSEYTLNKYLGYVSLKSTLKSNQVLAVAFDYTYGGTTYQVGEFSSDITNTDSVLYVKLLKNTSNSPKMGNWDLMMKNVYSLNAYSVQSTDFKLNIKYMSDTTGVYVNYLPEDGYKSTTLLKMMNLDRLDDNKKFNSNGKFDFLDGYTIQSETGRIIFPVVEPFGSWLRKKIDNDEIADKYCYDELYDSTKTVAKQLEEKNKFSLVGQYTATSGSEIDLGSMNIPQGSVVVTAGGVTLTENTDYTVDYSLGKVTIINESILDAGTTISVSLESTSEYSTMRKTMLGVNWTYDFSENFQLGGTLMRLTEKALTSKVSMGDEPLNNTLWGLNMNWKQNSQWLTNMIDKLPLLDVSQPSSVSLTAEFAQLISGTASGVQGNASYLDDFESTRTAIDVSTPQSWVLSSTPSNLEYGTLSSDVKYGYNRALLAWYNIDPLFTSRSSSLTPSHIKSDLNQLSNHYVREVYVNEVYPNRDTSSSSESSTLSILNMAYYPTERGPYNLDTDIDANGRLNNPTKRWGGMMRGLDTSDFETANIQYIEFWILDPFIYNRDDGKCGGDLYINLGDVSEDVLKDGKKQYESGLPVSSSDSYTETLWGRVPSSSSLVYSFSTSSGARELQDVGLDGLSDEDECTYGIYSSYLTAVQSIVNSEVYDSIYADPAGDDYHYFRGTDFDNAEVSVLDRYKHINGVDGNSPNSSDSGESYSTAYKSTPDYEDVDGDYTMNEYENFFQYHVSLRPEDLVVGSNFIVDERNTSVRLRNGNTEDATWYLFRIPVEDYESITGSISDFSSIRFMRMFLTDFEESVILRFASLDLVRGEWRNYTQSLNDGETTGVTGTLTASAINIEENNEKTPVNYILPPGISRVQDPSQPQLSEDNEQALSLVVENLASGDALAVYKTMNLDIRKYKHLQMFVHANALEEDQSLTDDQMSVFLRIGSDYKNNYYEYEIPLQLTDAGKYNNNSSTDREKVWPEENMLDIDFSVFTSLKTRRNKAKSQGSASYTELYYEYDDDNPANKISVMGNPSLGEVKTIMIGIRNNSRQTSSIEVWVNELRMQGYNNDGGWAAQGTLNVQLSDLGSVNLTGHTETAGFGGLEEGVTDRRDDNLYQWSITTSLELGKFFPEKWKMSLPFYYSYSWEKIVPKYNPFDTDILLDDALAQMSSKAERDSLKSIAETVTTSKNFSLSNWKSNYASRTPMPYDPANFSLSYSYSQTYTTGQTTVYENEENWKGSLSYNYSPKYKAWEPFKNLKGKSKWLDLIKAQNLNWLPQSISFTTNLSRSYYEYQERDLDGDSELPVTFSEQFLWDRQLAIRWDIFKSLKLNWTSATYAEIEEPNTVINKDLYPDEYSVWKDSVIRSLLSLGRPLTYNSTFTGSYQLPINKIPIFDWVTANGTYNSTYSWTRGTELEDGSSLGHTITTQRTANLSGKLDFTNLYKKWKFLENAEKRFSSKKSSRSNSKNKKNQKSSKDAKDSKDSKDAKDGDGDKDAKSSANTGKKKAKGFSQEITLSDSTDVVLKHGQNSKRIEVRAITKEGKTYKLKYKKIDPNSITIRNRDTIPLKINVVAKPNLEEKGWYKAAQVLARGLMMVRNANISYTNSYALTLPGFSTEIGDAFGQKNLGGALSPGLDFAFGMIDDSYVQKAAEKGWLIQNDSNITTPATSNLSENLQVKLSLEPITDLKIDLNASWTRTKAKSIQFMYEGMPTTHSGSFSMTIISAKTAFSSSGNIGNSYSSKPFNEFLRNISIVQSRVESQYAGSIYPAGSGDDFAGKTYDSSNGGVDAYSADVMVPAFLAAYCGYDAKSNPLTIFPSILRMLPNWKITYGGLSKLPWFSERFKSFNLSHSYKSVYAVGSYSSYSTFLEYMGDLGFITDVTTGNPIPSSMYNVSTVSINEAFSPLLGVDMTFNNDMTAKLEFKKTRVLSLSMTSVVLTETHANDIVLGWGYKIKDLNLFGVKSLQDTSGKKSKNSKNSKSSNTSSSKTTSRTSRSRTVSHDLNLSCNFSYRMQSVYSRNVKTAVTTATSGTTAYKLAIAADYTFSRLLTLGGYFDWQKSVPLVSTSSYPTTTADFGVTIKFSLTR